MIFKLHLLESVTDLLQKSLDCDIRQQCASLRWTHIKLQISSFDSEASGQLCVDQL